MKKKNVAALLCASVVLTSCPVNGIMISAEAAENQTEEQQEQTDTKTTSEAEKETGGETENPGADESNGSGNHTESSAGTEAPAQDNQNPSAAPDQTQSGEGSQNAPDQTQGAQNQGTQQNQNQASNEETAEVQKTDASADIQLVISAVSAAMEQTVPDMNSQVMQNFIQASNLFENDQTVFESISSDSPQTASDIVTVRNRIADVIAVDNNVRAQMLASWFIGIHAENVEEQSANEALKLYEQTYDGSHAEAKYAVNISYTDIRTGEKCDPTRETELIFPIPEGYTEMKNPQIFTVIKPTDGSESTIKLLTPEDNGDGNFYLQEAKDIQNLFIADVQTEIRGISLPAQVSVNSGQQTTLQLTTTPDKITESYELEWKSSDTSVAEADQNGKITGKNPGTATITVSVKGNESISASCTVTVVQGANALTKTVSQVLEETGSYIQNLDQNPTLGSEWFVLAQARNGADLNSSYFATYYNHFANYLQENNGVLTSTIKYTEYSKAILTLTAIGKDARNVAGYNLFAPLADFDKTVEQGPNGAIWALLAIDSNPAYSFPVVAAGGNQNSREKLITHLLSVQMPGGGWAMTGSVADSDLTGMALQALAPYYHKAGYENVTTAIDRALDVLANMQNDTGGFSTTGIETVESCAQVLNGLCALGIDPETDPRFIKGGKWMVENLISYHLDNSGFMHVKPGSGNNGGGEAGKVNGIATEQGYYALVAYQRLKNGQTGLYNMSDVTLTEGGKGDGKGTGIVTPTPRPTATPTKKPSQTTTKKKTTKKSTSSGKKTTAKTPGGSGRSLSGGSTGKSLSENKNASSDKKKKSSKGWNFEAEQYVEKEKTKGKTLTTEKKEVAAIEEENTDSHTEEKTTDTKQNGFPSAVWGFIGVCAGVLITKGPEQVSKWRKKKKA